MKSFRVLASFAHGFAFHCCAARYGIDCFLPFTRTGFRNCPPTLFFKPGQIDSA